MRKVNNNKGETMNKVSYIISNSGNVNLVVDGKSHTIAVDHINYEQIIECLKNEDYEGIEKLLDIASEIVKISQGKVAVLDGCVTYDGKEVINPLTDRILRFVNEDLPFKPMLNFLENLMENPSRTSVQELYLFLENNTLPITEDGHFLAYKKVNDNYMDFYTGEIDNSVGEKPSVDRNEVDDVRDHLCSEGLHFCSMEYLPKYHGGQGRVMILKINPKDVVSIPSDYNNAKGRCCSYEVIGEHTDPDKESKPAFNEAVYTYPSDGEDLLDGEYVDDYCEDCGEILDECTCCPECGCWYCTCNEPEEPVKPDESTLGRKPTGEAYHNVRDNNGRFCKK